ncbi:MAG: hypothetical protein ACP5I4_04305 [Oceanipulchritudo sp.]|jgi:hypothetical protein
MTSNPDFPRFAASFDWETLIPILFFVLYGIAQLFGSKKKGEAGGTEDDGEPEVDPIERARQIREEIRRKLEERRQVTYDPTVPEPLQRAPEPPVREWSRPMAKEPRRPTASPEPLIVKKAESLMAQKASMERRLEQQRERLDAARRRQAEARRQARKMVAAAGVRKKSLLEEPTQGVQATALKSLRQELLAGLSSRNSLRKAVLYREILDPPLGLR